MACDEGRHLQGIFGVGVNAHSVVCPNGQRFADHRVAIRFPHRDGGHRSTLGFLQLQRTHQRVPFVVGVDNELHPIAVELGVAFCEGNPARGVRRFADANENFHGAVFKV